MAAVLPKRRSGTELEAVPWPWIGSIAAALTAILLVAAPGYGYHRDELYFRLLGHHLAWGYTDQPPLTPLLARLATAVFGDNLVAIRVPAAVGAVFTVVLTALLARELGGTAAAQVRAAAGTASAALVLIAGHVLLTVSIDLPLTAAVILFAVRAILRGDLGGGSRPAPSAGWPSITSSSSRSSQWRSWPGYSSPVHGRCCGIGGCGWARCSRWSSGYLT